MLVKLRLLHGASLENKKEARERASFLNEAGTKDTLSPVPIKALMCCVIELECSSNLNFDINSRTS